MQTHTEKSKKRRNHDTRYTLWFAQITYVHSLLHQFTMIRKIGLQSFFLSISQLYRAAAGEEGIYNDTTARPTRGGNPPEPPRPLAEQASQTQQHEVSGLGLACLGSHMKLVILMFKYFYLIMSY